MKKFYVEIGKGSTMFIEVWGYYHNAVRENLTQQGFSVYQVLTEVEFKEYITE